MNSRILDLGTSLRCASASRPGSFTPWERTLSSNWIGGWVGPRTGLDGVERRKIMTLQGPELIPLGCSGVASRYADCAIPAPFHMFINRSFTSWSPADQNQLTQLIILELLTSLRRQRTHSVIFPVPSFMTVTKISPLDSILSLFNPFEIFITRTYKIPSKTNTTFSSSPTWPL
jgi:hypothetical protein